jgi:hypothetical protein
MTGTSRYRGFSSFDALFSMVPVLLMMLMLMEISSSLTRAATAQAGRQREFDSLVTIADHTVRSGAAVRSGGLRHPNWIDAGLIDGDYVESLRERAGFDSLYISTSAPAGAPGQCIYRIVVIGPEKKIGRLFVCGELHADG